MLLFHTHDEPGRPGWQSGLVYADGSPKTSLEPVRRAMESAGTGSLGLCPVTARCRPRSAPTNVRSRSDASAPVPTVPVSCACRVGRRWRRRAAAPPPAAASRSGSHRQRPCPAGTSSPSGFSTQRCQDALSSAPAPFLLRVSSPPRSLPDAEAAALIAPASGWSGRRRRQARGTDPRPAAGRGLRRGRDHEPGSRADRPGAGGDRRAPQRRRARRRHPDLPRRLPPGSATTPLTPEARTSSPPT